MHAGAAARYKHAHACLSHRHGIIATLYIQLKPTLECVRSWPSAMSSSQAVQPLALQHVQHFTDAFERAYSELTPLERNGISAATIKDVYHEIKVIQENQAKRRSLRNMKKLEPYINGLKSYSEVISIFVQVKPDLLALIWVGCLFYLFK